MKYYLIAGEASGDLHGCNLMRALLSLDPEADIRFWGGDRMSSVAEGAPHAHITQVRHIRDLAFMGFIEVLSHLSTVLGNIKFCKSDILNFHPDVVVFIDYPGFNLKIAKFTHSHGFRNVYYISPQIWAWKKGRIRPMRRDLDGLCYILPTEQKFYSENSFPQAFYVGHPLLDEVERYRTSENHNTVKSSKPVIALLPGSRKQELKRVLPAMLHLAKNHCEYQFTIAGMRLIGEDLYRQIITENIDNVTVVYDCTYDLLASSYAAIVCSGTATLETGLFRVPQVVCYQCNRLSAAIARVFIASRIKYISLINLIDDSPVICELIQGDYNYERLEKEFGKITVDKEAREDILSGYDRVIGLLGGTGASQRTATKIIEIANGK